MINKLLEIAKGEIGYLEKKSNSNLYDKKANAGQNNYTKYWAEIYPDYQGQPWCACFVTWCFVQAFGKVNASSLLGHYPFVYCPTLANIFKHYKTPQIGDIVLFYKNNEFVHTGIVSNVNKNYFETIEGNTTGISTIIPNGGEVCSKCYYTYNLPGTVFIRPNYGSLESEDLTMTQYDELKKMVDELSKKIDDLHNPMIYNYVDENMPEWARGTIAKLVNKGILIGTGDGLNLTENDLRHLVINDRSGLYD